MNRLLFGIILIAVSWTASAADIVLYKVELIVFENLDPDALKAEDWPDNPGTPPLDNAMELNALIAASAATARPVTPVPGDESTAPVPANPAAAEPAQSPTPPIQPAAAATGTPIWRLLDKSELSLNGAEQKMRNSGRYNPFLHIGWVQPLDSSDQGTLVHIYDGMESAQQNPTLTSAVSDVNAQKAAIPNQAGTTPEATSNQPPASEQPPHTLDGTFTLRRGRFLHVDVDLGFRKSYLPEDGTQTTDMVVQPLTQYVRMIQSRRIRNDELHYLDHPLFGVLFVVTPYETNPPVDGTAK